MTINDSIKRKYIIDTGSQITNLAYDDFQSLGLEKSIPNLKKISKTILGNNFETLYTTISAFALHDSMRGDNLKIGMYKNCLCLVGNNYLKNFIITLNYKL